MRIGLVLNGHDQPPARSPRAHVEDRPGARPSRVFPILTIGTARSSNSWRAEFLLSPINAAASGTLTTSGLKPDRARMAALLCSPLRLRGFCISTLTTSYFEGRLTTYLRFELLVHLCSKIRLSVHHCAFPNICGPAASCGAFKELGQARYVGLMSYAKNGTVAANRLVAGSNPAQGAIYFKGLAEFPLTPFAF